jgi:hypothetical protein
VISGPEVGFQPPVGAAAMSGFWVPSRIPTFCLGCRAAHLPARIAVMQPVIHHIDQIVRPGLRKYAAAERVLTDAQIAKDQAAIGLARTECEQASKSDPP